MYLEVKLLREAPRILTRLLVSTPIVSFARYSASTWSNTEKASTRNFCNPMIVRVVRWYVMWCVMYDYDVCVGVRCVAYDGVCV